MYHPNDIWDPFLFRSQPFFDQATHTAQGLAQITKSASLNFAEPPNNKGNKYLGVRDDPIIGISP